MSAIAFFRRHSSEPFSGAVERDEKGRPFFRYQAKCLRCGGAGGADKWAHTGWSCFDCGGTGDGPILSEPLYTAEQIARMNAASEKRAAKKAEAARVAEEARRAPFLAWLAENQHLVDQVTSLGDDRTRAALEADLSASRIPPDWRLPSAIAGILRVLARDDQRATSDYLGTVGARIDLDLVCERVLSYGDRWQPFFIAIMRDRENNRIVYKGSTPPLGEGQEGRFRATVKAHEERDGERQTVVQRLRELELTDSEVAK